MKNKAMVERSKKMLVVTTMKMLMKISKKMLVVTAMEMLMEMLVVTAMKILVKRSKRSSLTDMPLTTRVGRVTLRYSRTSSIVPNTEMLSAALARLLR
jgi:hypothetical protein